MLYNKYKIREGFKKFSTFGFEPPYKWKKVIFSEIKPFLSTFRKRCIFTIENQKKIRKLFNFSLTILSHDQK